MLWVDDNFVTLADLVSMDSEVNTLANTAGFALSTTIQRAQEMCETALGNYMSFSGLSPSDLTLRQTNAPLILASSLRYNYASFSQIVVSGETDTSWSAIKQWVVAKTLVRMYQNVGNKHGDRYSDKLDDIKDTITRHYWPAFKRRGIPIIFSPMVSPGAIMNRCGSFTQAQNVILLDTSSPGTFAGTVSVAITWTGSNYVNSTNKNNAESYRSQVVQIPLQPGKIIQVNIYGLTPPNGSQPLYDMPNSRYSPLAATGWNVYMGNPDIPPPPGLNTTGLMYQQNPDGAPIPLSQTTFTLPGDPVIGGSSSLAINGGIPILDYGQVEDIILEISDELQRA